MILTENCSKILNPCRILVAMATKRKTFKKSSCQKPLDRLQNKFAEMFLWWSSTKIVQAIMICQKAYFALYIYIENFKNILVRNHGTNITWQKCSFGDPLPRLFKPSWYVKKNGCWGAELIFPIYLYRKVKNLLVRNHWTDFNIIWQECSFGDPLPILFKQSWFVKKHGC